MIELHFILSLESDWHINAGYGRGTYADAVLERDLNGQPMIAGSTLKGLFRDALYDLQHKTALGNHLAESDLHHILGSPQAASAWRFSAGRISENENRLAPTQVVTGLRVDPATRRAAEGQFYQRELGGGGTFEFIISGDGDQVEVELLIAAARYIRHLGGGRRRGNGACQIYLFDHALQDDLLKAFEQRYFGHGQPASLSLPPDPNSKNGNDGDKGETVKARHFRVIIRAEQPILIAQKAESGNNFAGNLLIPGRSLRGAIAQRAKPQALPPNDYETFVSLFMQGGVSFQTLYPLLPDGRPLDKAPLGLKRDEEGRLYSALNAGEAATPETDEQSGRHKDYKKFIGLADGLPLLDDPARQMRIHVQIDPISKHAKAGDLYSYEAMPAGSYYVGEFSLKAEHTWADLASLSKLSLQSPITIHLGKANSRGYGECRIWIEALEEDEPVSNVGISLADRLAQTATSSLYITLASDLIWLDDFGRAAQDFHPDWLAELLGLSENEAEPTLNILDSRARSRLVEGYDFQSGLPTWRDMAIQSGSTVLVAVNHDTLDLDRLKRLEQEGFGLRKSEGFGRIIFNHPAHIGLTTGFTPPISIPRSKRVEPFLKRWGDILQGKFKAGYFEKAEFRSLARLLVEADLQTVADMENLLTKLGQPDSDRFAYSANYIAHRADKKLFPEKSRQHLRELLQLLAEENPNEAEWRQGLVLLAEKIATSAKKREN